MNNASILKASAGGLPGQFRLLRGVLAAGMILSGLAMPPSRAQAQEEFVFEPSRIEACLAGKEGIDRLSCTGTGAGHCMEASPGGSSTVGMGFCLGKELDWWDARLNEVYGRLADRESEADVTARSEGWNAPEKLPALKDMQRKWITYRDARCEYEAVQWGGGTGAGPAYADCLMMETARQYWVLQDTFEGWE